MGKVRLGRGETLREAAVFTHSEKMTATERQRANICSWGDLPLSMPPKTEGRGDGYDPGPMPRFGSRDR